MNCSTDSLSSRCWSFKFEFMYKHNIVHHNYRLISMRHFLGISSSYVSFHLSLSHKVWGRLIISQIPVPSEISVAHAAPRHWDSNFLSVDFLDYCVALFLPVNCVVLDVLYSTFLVQFLRIRVQTLIPVPSDMSAPLIDQHPPGFRLHYTQT